jgi:hypothetical protein
MTRKGSSRSKKSRRAGVNFRAGFFFGKERQMTKPTVTAIDLVLSKLAQFSEVVELDFEFGAKPGDRQDPICLVTKELRSGRMHRIFRDDFGKRPPYSTGPSVLHVAYYSSAEWGCYRSLGWPMPERVLDLFVEFRNLTNGLPLPAGASLLGALAYFRIAGINAAEKSGLQEALGAGTWRGRYSKSDILNYCEQDVLALERLLLAMLPGIDLPRALLRGRYMVAVSAIEWNGIPIDVPTLERLRESWTSIQGQLIADVDKDYGVYDGRSFRSDRFADWLIRRGIPWPRLDEGGRLDLSDDTFRQMAKSHPAVSPLRELRSSLSDLRLNDLVTGRDSRARCLLSPFRSRTGRNQPSNARFIFGPSVWIRSLIKPPTGYGVAYIDWGSQEFAIAAALSQDPNMIAGYLSGDPYLAFGKQTFLIPPDGTKESHKAIRELCKQCALAVQYGMAEESLAMRIDRPVLVARDLLRLHRETFAKFWRWSDSAIDVAMLKSSIQTRFGWTLHIGGHVNPRSLRNWPVQSNGAEMMRIAACLATERGIEVNAPVHDAFLICAPLDRLEADIAKMRAAMAEASRAVLDGFEVRTDVDIVKYPNRYVDKREQDKELKGIQPMWKRVLGLLQEVDA